MDIKTIRKTRLRQWVAQNGTPQAEKSFFSQLMHPDGSFGEKAARRLEEKYGMGEGYLDRNDDIVQIGGDGIDDITISQYRDVRGSMGYGVILRDQPGEIHRWNVTPEWLDKNVKSYTGIKNLAIVTGFGDSMKGMYNPGDPLLVDRGITTVDFDGVYFFRVGDEGFIKRLQRVPGEGLVAISENKAYREWTIKPDMDFEVFARVIKVWQGADF